MPANSSVEQCLNIIRELDNDLNSAKRALMSGDNCIVNRGYMLGRIRQLNDSLPTAFRTASEYVKNITTIKQQAEQESTTLLRDSQYKSRQIVEEAEKQAAQTTEAAQKEADDTLSKAQREAEATVTAARQQAQMILEEAQRNAEMLLDKESIVRRARVEASELRESAQQEMAVLRQNTFDYLDTMLDQVDRGLSETLGSIRRERAELNDHR